MPETNPPRRSVTLSVEVEPDAGVSPDDIADLLRTLARGATTADLGPVVGASWTTYTYQDSELPTPILSSVVAAETVELPLVHEGRAVVDSPQA